MHQLLPEDD